MNKPVRFAYKKSQTTDLTAAILDYLHKIGIPAWRMNTGAARVRGGRQIRFGFKGCSDIVGILHDGRWLAVEVKREYDKPRPEQIEFLAMVEMKGGIAMIARRIEDVIQKIDLAYRRAG